MTDTRCPMCGDWDCRCPAPAGETMPSPMRPSRALPTVDDMQDWLGTVLSNACQDQTNHAIWLLEMQHALAAWEVWKALDTIRREKG
jgi:hypothetical protein